MAPHLASLDWPELESLLARQQDELKSLLGAWKCRDVPVQPSDEPVMDLDNSPVLLGSTAACAQNSCKESCATSASYQQEGHSDEDFRQCSAVSPAQHEFSVSLAASKSSTHDFFDSFLSRSGSIRPPISSEPPRNSWWTLARSKTRWDLEGQQLELQAMSKAIGRSSRFAGRAVGRESSEVQKRSSQSVQQALKRLVDARAFQTMSAAFIIGSGVLVGAQVQHRAETLGQSTPAYYELLQWAFNIVFIIELCLCWMAAGREFLTSPRDRFWNMFDTLCVSATLLELVATNLSDAGSSSFMGLLRIVRLVRVVRIFRVVRYLSYVRRLIFALAQSMDALFWSILLMMLSMGFFAITLTQGAVDELLRIQMETDDLPETTEALQMYWGSLPRTTYTLFLSVTGGINWHHVGQVLQNMHWMYFLLFLSFMAFWLFAFMNVVNGFFVENAFTTVQRDRDDLVEQQLQDRDKHISEFQRIFGDFDASRIGEITCDQLESRIDDERLQLYFSALELNVSKAWDIFKLLDEDRSGTVSIDEFVYGCLRLRGPAKNIDIAILSHDVHVLSKKLVEFMEFVDVSFECMPTRLATSGIYQE